MFTLNRLVHALHQAHDEQQLFYTVRDKPVQVLTESGEVFDIVDVEYDPAAEVTYIKCELPE